MDHEEDVKNLAGEIVKVLHDIKSCISPLLVEIELYKWFHGDLLIRIDKFLCDPQTRHKLNTKLIG